MAMNNPNYGYSATSSFSTPHSSTPPAGIRPSRPRFAYSGPSMLPRPRSSASKPNPDSSFYGTRMNSFGSEIQDINSQSIENHNSYELNDSTNSLYYSCNESFLNSPNKTSGNSEIYSCQQSNVSQYPDNDFCGYSNKSSGNGLSYNNVKRQNIFGGNHPQGYNAASRQREFSPNYNTTARQNDFSGSIQRQFNATERKFKFSGNSANFAKQNQLQNAGYLFGKKNTSANRVPIGGFQNFQNSKQSFGGPFSSKKAFKAKRSMAQKGEWRCELCNLDFTSQIPLDMHLRGAKHNKKLKAQTALEIIHSQGQAKKVDTVGNVFRCEPCSLILNSSLQLQMHLDGTKHKNKIQKLEQEKEGPKKEQSKETDLTTTEQNGKGSESLTRPLPADFDDPRPTKLAKYSCEICNLILNSQMQLQQHLGSKRHEAKVQGIPFIKARKLKKPLVEVKTEDETAAGEDSNNLGEENKNLSSENEVEVVAVKSLQASFIPAELPQ